ncbi:TonB family protein [Hymenobacter koreensis]
MPRFRAGNAQDSLMSYLAQHMIYPVEAQREQIKGKVYVSFVVGQTGKVSAARILKGVHPSLDAEAVRVVSSMPAWELPGRHNGNVVAVAYTVPVSFQLEDPDKYSLNQLLLHPHQETVCRFPDGPVGLRQYLNQPAGPGQPQGMVFVRFYITPEGRVAKPHAIPPLNGEGKPNAALRAATKALCAAAEKCIAAMPAWTPATVDGSPRASTYILPVQFSSQLPTADTPLPYADQGPVIDNLTTDVELVRYLEKSVQYPALAVGARAQETVLAYFVVNSRGQVEQPVVLQSAGPLFDTEALRAIRALPVQRPAQLAGQPVSVFFVVPVTFELR